MNFLPTLVRLAFFLRRIYFLARRRLVPACKTGRSWRGLSCGSTRGKRRRPRGGLVSSGRTGPVARSMAHVWHSSAMHESSGRSGTSVRGTVSAHARRCALAMFEETASISGVGHRLPGSLRGAAISQVFRCASCAIVCTQLAVQSEHCSQ